ncbi:MAG: succinyl-CoA--3-ketoacid-CoA transferase [Candidatus Xenobia bacterium]|jgi:3-oxoacid CoA-transferase subunit B
MSWSREEQARRAGAELKDGDIVNLGIGLPTEVANYVPEGIQVMFHSENGLLGMGPFPYEDEIDPQVINAGKQTVTLARGASLFDSALSFAMIRGGHVDVAILGGLEVAQNGDLANWMIPGKMVTGMGGAMDLAGGAKKTLVMQTHTSKTGESKLMDRLSLPATALGCVNRVITELGVFDCCGDHFLCLELAPGVSREEAVARTKGELRFA